jgi:hypothetical protein
MSEIGLVEYFGMGEAIGIIATLFVILYFSRKQMQTLSVDIETKILNDLDERIHEMTRMGIEQPQLINVISKSETGWSAEIAYAYHIMYTFAHVFHMRQRKVLNDNEWIGWPTWMKSAFEEGSIKDIWENNIEMEKWFDPAFQEFIDKELIPMSRK